MRKTTSILCLITLIGVLASCGNDIEEYSVDQEALTGDTEYANDVGFGTLKFALSNGLTFSAIGVGDVSLSGALSGLSVTSASKTDSTHIALSLTGSISSSSLTASNSAGWITVSHKAITDGKADYMTGIRVKKYFLYESRTTISSTSYSFGLSLRNGLEWSESKLSTATIAITAADVSSEAVSAISDYAISLDKENATVDVSFKSDLTSFVGLSLSVFADVSNANKGYAIPLSYLTQSLNLWNE